MVPSPIPPVPAPFTGAVILGDLDRAERERILDDLFKANRDDIPGQLQLMADDYEGNWTFNCE
jgi:hypothetical protein